MMVSASPSRDAALILYRDFQIDVRHDADVLRGYYWHAKRKVATTDPTVIITYTNSRPQMDQAISDAIHAVNSHIDSDARGALVHMGDERGKIVDTIANALGLDQNSFDTWTDELNAIADHVDALVAFHNTVIDAVLRYDEAV